VIDDALATQGSPPKTGHVGFRGGFVNEDQAPAVELQGPGLPLLAAFDNVRAILFAGRQRFFLGCNQVAQPPVAPP
jgi:hypothetical protein